ncbi:O-methyltransferase [Lachnellula subtilissima]|uniref:O-methyltransferase n=1 Tax=Lachnellula subtilissima TaxID=602034 RepID=A0A8H8U4R1_9HELO|nr:O-methyltransferase [Lachnellula subtilissima]
MTRIAELASIILEQTTNIDKYLNSNGIPTPSFTLDAAVEPAFPEQIIAARDVVLDANMELSELLLGPRQTFVEYQYNYFVSMQALYRYKVASAFPVGKEATFAEVAKNCNCSEDTIARILRHAITNRIFKEVRKGVIAHTATSRVLAEDPLFQDYVGMRCEEMWPAELHRLPAITKWPDSQDPAETGFSLANDSLDTMYNIMAKDPTRAKRFSGGMAFRLTGPTFKLDFLVDHGSWGLLPAGGTVVDIGGSHGQAVLAIAKKFPSLHFVVQDLPSTIAAHRPIPEGSTTADISFLAHDFFTPQPVASAEVYLFRWIFHNWPDKYCLLILENLVPALKPGARIIVNEICLPEPNTMSTRRERRLRSMDIGMLTLQNARERNRDDWISLFKRADERYNFAGVTEPEGSDLAIIEFAWQTNMD